MDLLEEYRHTRAQTETLCARLNSEDMVVQPFDHVSPPKWHLAHTTWFFETFILDSFSGDYQYYDDSFQKKFNSYYKQIGDHWKQSQRGTLSRPTVSETMEYRNAIDTRILELSEKIQPKDRSRFDSILEIGIHHEKQHQELLLMDIKSILSCNLKSPVFSSDSKNTDLGVPQEEWISFPGGLVEIGENEERFSIDNERPKHKVFLEPFKISNRLVSNAEFLKFIEFGGYTKPEYWLSDGWDILTENKWNSPLYWQKNDSGKWIEVTLNGLKELNLDEPVSHISFFEADAYARYLGFRLPTEFEWEEASRKCDFERPSFPKESMASVFQESNIHHPIYSIQKNGPFYDLLGNLWEWTASAYLPYPGFRPANGALGEYNGKFMCNQMVLRGGCLATPADHIRTTYRNFYRPEQRWMFSGIRLAQ